MVVRCAGQLRVSGMGTVLGLDLGTAMKIGEALGYDARTLAELLPEAEAGLLAGLAKLSDEGEG